MHKKNGLINELIPADDLHWDEVEKKHVVLSEQDQNDIFRACFNCGLEEEDVLKVMNAYNFYKTSELLFKHFLEGNIGVYRISKSGEPIFEKLKSKQTLEVLYCPGSTSPQDVGYSSLGWDDDLPIEESFGIGLKSGTVYSSHSRDLVPFDRMFHTILCWCSKNGFNLWENENPDNDDTWLNIKDEDVVKSIKQKGWRIANSECKEDGSLYLEIELGRWFEFIEDDSNEPLK